MRLRKSLKKSLKKQMILIFLGVIALVVVTSFIINSQFLEKYYIVNKQKTLVNAYSEINSAIGTKDVDTDEFQLKIEKVCAASNISIYAIDTSGNVYLSSSTDEGMAPLFQLATRVLSEGKDREKAKDYLITAASGRHRPSAGLLFAVFGAADFLLIAPAQMAEAPETAAKLEEASRNEKEKDLDTANRIWLSLAEEGVAEAQYNLGYSLDTGEGLEKTPALALFWYACAASQGHIKAMFRLGHLFDADSVLKELVNAAVSAAWYQKAAELGHPRAAAFLGFDFENGEGVEKSLEEALKWYRIAAEHGDSVGMKRT